MVTCCLARWWHEEEGRHRKSFRSKSTALQCIIKQEKQSEEKRLEDEEKAERQRFYNEVRQCTAF